MIDETQARMVPVRPWHSDPALVVLLGVLPGQAVVISAVQGLALGLAALLVLIVSSASLSLIAGWIKPGNRILVYALVIASMVMPIELIMSAYFHQLYAALGIYLPLLAMNCAIIALATDFGSQRNALASVWQGAALGAGFASVLVIVGGLRELLAHGTLLAHAQLLFGGAGDLAVAPTDHRQGLLLAASPPGAFIGLGLLLALKNVIGNRIGRRAGR